MDSSPENKQDLKAFRPKFLTILCYITIFASSWVFVQSLAGLMNPEQVSLAFSKNLDQMQSQFENSFARDPAAGEQVEKLMNGAVSANTVSNMRDHSFFSMISNLLTLLGAMLMLRLRKNGFKLYFLGILISIISPLLVFGFSNLLGIAFAIYTGILGLIFTILYAVRLKYME